MKKFAFIFIVLLTSLVNGQSSTYPGAKIDSLLNDKFFDSTLLSMEVYNSELDSTLFAINNNLLLHPASNMKILTSAAALYFLGFNYKFVTTLYLSGVIKGETLKGNIYLKGGFDPDFTSDDLERFVTAIENLGIKYIQGNIYADVSAMDSLFWGNGWMWNDDPYADFPYMTPMNINDDCVNIIVKPTNIGRKAVVNILPHSLFYTFDNQIITTSDSSNFRGTRDWIKRKNHFVFTGFINVNAEPDTFKLNLVNTNLYAATLLKEALYRDGVNCFGIVDTQSVPKRARLIGQFERPLTEVLKNMNKISDNLSAEMTLRALGLKYFGPPSGAKKGIKMVDSLISVCGLNPSDYRIVDGSGVSHYNLITTHLIVSVLKYLKNKKPALFEFLTGTFPLAGVDGTLKHRMKHGAAYNNVKAKTGTLSGVSTLSGILVNSKKQKIIFSIFIQNYNGSSKRARKFQDEICNLLAH